MSSILKLDCLRILRATDLPRLASTRRTSLLLGKRASSLSLTTCKASRNCSVVFFINCIKFPSTRALQPIFMPYTFTNFAVCIGRNRAALINCNRLKFRYVNCDCFHSVRLNYYNVRSLNARFAGGRTGYFRYPTLIAYRLQVLAIQLVYLLGKSVGLTLLSPVAVLDWKRISSVRCF